MEGIEHLMENQAFSKRAGSHQEGYVRYGSSYGSGYENICGAPQIVYVPQGRMSESEAGGPATGNVPVLLLLGLYGLLAVFTLARLLTANLTAFQVLQGDPAVTAGKRFRRDLAVGRESFNPGQISKLITAISMTMDREHIGKGSDAKYDISWDNRSTAVSTQSRNQKPQFPLPRRSTQEMPALSKEYRSHVPYSLPVYGVHESKGRYTRNAADCTSPVVYVMSQSDSRTSYAQYGVLGALLAGIPALLSAIATGAPTIITNDNN